MKSLEEKAKHATYMREWRKNKPEYKLKQREALRRFKAKHPTYDAEYARKWKFKNQEKAKINSKNYRLRHPDKIKKFKKEYEKNNIEKKRCRCIAGYYPMAKQCNICGSTENLERHHPDYSKPKIFETLCRDCHNKITKCERILLEIIK